MRNVGCRISSAGCRLAAADRLGGDAGAVAAQPELSFAGLLRQLRAEARLTQEELAEAAGVSPGSVSNLERGINRTAHKDTAVLLAGALGLAGRRESCSWRRPVARPRPQMCWWLPGTGRRRGVWA